MQERSHFVRSAAPLRQAPSASRGTRGLEPRPLASIVGCILLAIMGTAAWAGQVRGKVVDAGNEALPGVTLELANTLTGYSAHTIASADGSFAFYNVPENPYQLRATLNGFAPFHVDLDVRGSIPVPSTVRMTAQFGEATTVTAEKENVALETDEPATHVDVDKSLIRRFPAATASRAFEAIVTSAPGFSKDENGRYHFQGGHSQQLLVIDGQPIGDQIGVTFSNSLNPAIAEGIEITTGGVPAEFGEKAYGVINLTTRSALGHPGLAGDASVGVGKFATREGDVAAGYGSGHSGLFLNLDGSQSDRFLDPPTFGDLHNHGYTARGFLRYDGVSEDGADSWRLTTNAGRTNRDVPNLPSQQDVGQDEVVHSRDWNANAGWQHVSHVDLVLEGQVYARSNRLELFASPNDTPVIATQDRTLDNRGLNAALTKVLGRNEIKVGVQAKTFPIHEHFSFLITDPGLNDPAAPNYNPNLAPYDGTRGGSPFVFDGVKSGRYSSVYAQDTVHWQDLTINAGLRYDDNRLFLSESQWSPRIGLAYSIPVTKTVLRASYDRMFITPEYENILISSSAQASALSPPEVQQSGLAGFGHLFNVAEHHDAYNAGIQQGIGSSLRLDLSYWKRKVKNTADQDQFFNTGIVFPLNFKGGDLSGWNLRLDGGPVHGVRGYLSLGHVHALYTPPLVGGLFINTSPLGLDQAPFLIDHDQNLQEQLGLYWDIPGSGFWTGVTERYDSGLVTHAGVLADVLAGGPDTAYAAPYIDFGANPQRIKPRTIWDFSLGARLEQYGLPFELQVDLLNAFDKQGLYNFQSTFGGTHVIPPRTLAGRIRFVF